ncbi:hypothetical protein [Burkholderia diffusa]|uniref:Uncharacterized protein n=1 Tax=Burkholderia diffusa TaxID=488732 RepID=A0A6P2QT69_9BURK|nr:hypothetical protein [Burkholderia diffusa]KAB0655722.1 hypothetical protein F7R23_15650 [Burkholderia diffusa]MBM2656840.1 hypothetical protein [Burkholderia diffusa]VWC25658.1 hypothetical protein BDI24065_06101 [Burkholderia diffusa]
MEFKVAQPYSQAQEYLLQEILRDCAIADPMSYIPGLPIDIGATPSERTHWVKLVILGSCNVSDV